MFTGAMGLMEGRGIEGTKQKFKDVSSRHGQQSAFHLGADSPNLAEQMYWPALLANWQVWPLVQAINFRFMPLR